MLDSGDVLLEASTRSFCRPSDASSIPFGRSEALPILAMDGLGAASAQVGAAWLVQRCTHAIHVGAPLYNKGASAECAAIYHAAILACIQHTSNSMPEAVLQIFHEVLWKHSVVSASRRAVCTGASNSSLSDHTPKNCLCTCSPANVPCSIYGERSGTIATR